MRRVGQKEIDQLSHALDDLSAITERIGSDSRAADRKMKAIAQDGRTEEAETFGVRELARLRLVYVDAGAQFEIEVVRVLGERRGSGESLDDYAARISWTMQDLSRVLAMQRRNGIVLVMEDGQ